MKNWVNGIFLFIVMMNFYPSLAYADEVLKNNVVNILTWWDYLRQPEIINDVEKKCGAKISFDEYYSNDEFMRRWKENKSTYDVIIFSNTIYNGIKNEINTIKESKLHLHANNYNPTIKRHYIKANYPHNVIYFVHSLSGILYNPKTISPNLNDSLISIFHKANNHIVVMIDDPVEANKLLNIAFDNSHTINNSFFTTANFLNLIQQTHVYIGNGIKHVHLNPEFAFAYTWSGEGIDLVEKSHNKLKFIIHPKLSYVTSDLLAQTSNNKTSACVAEYLSSQQILNKIENNNYYFSPYANKKNIVSGNFLKLYNEFILSLDKLKWLEPIKENEFHTISRKWDAIKLDVLNQNKNFELS